MVSVLGSQTRVRCPRVRGVLQPDCVRNSEDWNMTHTGGVTEGRKRRPLKSDHLIAIYKSVEAMKTKFLSASVSVQTGAVILIMTASSWSEGVVQKPKPVEKRLSSPPKVEKMAPNTSLPLTVQLPAPPTSSNKALPRPTASSSKTAAAISERKRVEPLKPNSLDEKKKSQQAVFQPMRPRSRIDVSMAVKRENNETQIKSPGSEIHDTHQLTAEDAKNGRTLLRILEAGKGPSVTLSWPFDKTRREAIYELLRRCYAMKTVVYVKNSGLYRRDDPSGSTWKLNTDTMSTFIRQPSGGFSDDERRIISSINRRHSIRIGVPVRIFPRSVDASLLGGIRRLVGSRYSSAKEITADYFADGGGIGLMNVRIDDENISGRFVLPKLPTCR